MRISASQIKMFCWSKAKRAGQNILWIKDNYSNDSYIVWKLLENYLITWKDNIEEVIGDSVVDNLEKILQDYENAKYNTQWLVFEKWVTQYKVEWQLLWQQVLWYVDNITDNWIDEIKTSHYVSNPEKDSKNSWSNMTPMEEYRLQVWIYMKLLWRTKAKVIEIPKHRYKDWPRFSIFEFILTPEKDKEMEEKYQPIVNEMSELYNKFKTDGR